MAEKTKEQANESGWGYVGVKRRCWCRVAAVVDLPNNPELTNESIREMVDSGLLVSRVSYSTEKPLTVRGCKCGAR